MGRHERINDLNSIGDGTLLLGLRDWHVHNLFGGELLHTFMRKHFDGLNNLFLTAPQPEPVEFLFF